MEKTCEIFNKDGKRAIDAKSIASLTECVMDLPQTKLDHVSKNGEYSESRKKLHAKIISEFKEGVVCIDKGKPIAVLMGGSPASGKSTFLKKYRPYLLTDNLFKVDADEIRAKLPEYKGWNATQTHEETGDIVKILISDKNIGVPCKFDFIYDGTMTSTKKYLSLIDLLKEEGYEVFVVFISNIPKKVVKKRALERYQKSGRFVPMMVIDDFYENGEKTFDQVKSKVDGYIVVNGSTFDYNIMEKGGKSLPNKRLYGKLGHKLEFALGGAIGEEYNSALLTQYQNKALNKVLENPIFNNALEIETFESGGGFVHTMVLLSNNHVVTFNHEDDNIQYSYYLYNSLEDYLSEETFELGEKGWDNEMYTPNSGMRVAEISRPTNKFFEKMKKTKSPEDWKSHGLEFIPYKDTEIMHTLDDNKYYANDAEFDTLEAAQKFYDSGEIPENIREAYRRGLFRKGGNLGKETNEMFESQIVETKHHAKELDSLVDSKTEIEPWVLAKMTRAKTDLSDLTHYLDGQSKASSKKSFGRGGSILDEYEEEQFQEWMEDGNVIEREKGVFSTQDAQYSNRLKGIDALKKYFKKEFLSDDMSHMYDQGGNIKWSDAVIGDSALVVSENKMGLIVKDYGRKFHLKFPDGKEKTYDASELKFYKLGDDEYADGGPITKNEGEGLWSVLVHYEDMTNKESTKFWRKQFTVDANSREEAYAKALELFYAVKANKNRKIQLVNGFLLKPKKSEKMAGGGGVDEKLYVVVGKKGGQLVEITELPMSKSDAERWIMEQKIKNYYQNVDLLPYHGSKPRFVLPKYAGGGDVNKISKGSNVYAYFANNYMGYQLVESPAIGEPYDGKVVDIIDEDGKRKYVVEFENGETKKLSQNIFDDYVYLKEYSEGGKMAGGGDVRNMDWFTMWTREGLQVELGAISNPDMDEDNEIEFKRVSVKSIDEAVKLVKNFISENDLGSGEFIGAQIYNNGKPIAYVSYNLKVWEGKIGNLNSEPYQYMSGGKVHFKPSDFYKLGGSVEDMTPVEAFFSQLDYSKLPDGFANYVRDEILTDAELEAVSENDPIFIEIKSKVNSLMGKMATPMNDENSETQEAIDLLNELAVDQEGEEKRETLEAIELLKELLV
jgi:predicted ABC-type ATPase